LKCTKHNRPGKGKKTWPGLFRAFGKGEEKNKAPRDHQADRGKTRTPKIKCPFRGRKEEPDKREHIQCGCKVALEKRLDGGECHPGEKKKDLR